MSAEAAFIHFIRPMMVAFRDPPSGDAEAFFQDLAGELSCFTEYQLEAGARQLRHERTARTFPTMAECIAACDRWPKQRPVIIHSEARAEDNGDLGSAFHRKKVAHQMMRQDYAFSRQASKDGWLGQLFDYVMERGVMPPHEAAGRLKAQAEKVRGELAAVEGFLGLSLVESYRTRYKTIQQGVFGE